MTFQTMCALRIYLKRGDHAPSRGLLGRLFKRPLSAQLLQSALKAGVTHASLSLGSMGFAKGAKVVANDISDIPVSSMPVCVELVGPKQLLEQFVRDHLKLVTGATLVMLEGVHVMPAVVEGELPTSAHHVEYVKAGQLRVSVDHVDVPEELSAKAS
jgi:PII-like signaling protein